MRAQSSLFGDGVDIDTETPASVDVAAPGRCLCPGGSACGRAAPRARLPRLLTTCFLDAPEITDAAFDSSLSCRNRGDPDLVTPDSYTQRVGGYVSEQFTPVTHMVRMYSSDDAMD